MPRLDRRTVLEIALAATAVVFAALFLLGVGGTVSVKTRTVEHTKTVVKVVPQPGVAVGERAFSLNIPKEQAVFPDPTQVNRQLPGSGPSWAQTSLMYMVGPTLVQVISSRLSPAMMKLSTQTWERTFKEPFAIDKRPYSLQGHPAYLYVNKTQAYLQLVLVARIKAQMYMIMVGDPLPATEAQELPKLADIVSGLKLNPSPKPLAPPSFKDVCGGAKYQLRNYRTHGLTLKQARDYEKEACDRSSEFWKHESDDANHTSAPTTPGKHRVVHVKIGIPPVKKKK